MLLVSVVFTCGRLFLYCWSHFALVLLLSLFSVFLIVFFYKQKTAYEMRISDWSYDVCTSDLCDGPFGKCQAPRNNLHQITLPVRAASSTLSNVLWRMTAAPKSGDAALPPLIALASCRYADPTFRGGPCRIEGGTVK